LASEHQDIVDAIHDRMEFTDEITAEIERAVSEFKERFGG
jgi:hypothetical protein